MQKQESTYNKPLSGWLVASTLVVVVAGLGFCFFSFFLPRWMMEGIWWSLQLGGQIAAVGLFIYWWRNGRLFVPQKDTARTTVSVWRVLITLAAVVVTFGLGFFIRLRLPRWAAEDLAQWFKMSGLALGLGAFIYWWSNNVRQKL